jgi:hypothetical protein
MKNLTREELVDLGEISLAYTEQSGCILYEKQELFAFSSDQAVIQISRAGRYV